jgi:uncharacterized protein DUF6869
VSVDEALELCKRWLADGGGMTADRRDGSPLRTQVKHAPHDWFEAVLMLARDPAHVQAERRLGWPLAMVMESEAKRGAQYERLAVARAKNDRNLMPVVVSAIGFLDLTEPCGTNLYTAEFRVLNTFGEDDVLDSWRRLEPAPVASQQIHPDRWAYDVLFGITWDYREEAWRLITRLIDEAPNEDVAHSLSFSWLETYVQQHDDVIERIEEKAARSARFRRVLRGCYAPLDSPDVAARMEAAGKEPGRILGHEER